MTSNLTSNFETHKNIGDNFSRITIHGVHGMVHRNSWAVWTFKSSWSTMSMNIIWIWILGPWIWISNFSWTHEYEYGHVTPWTFKSSYSSWNFKNHAMNSMNCNAWLWLLFAALSQNCELPKLWNPYFLLSGIKKSPEKKTSEKKILGQTKSVGEWFFYLFMGDKCCLHLWLNTPEYFFLGSVFFIFRYISTTKSALRCMFCLQQSANACFESSI